MGKNVRCEIIGVIHSPWTTEEGMPIQPGGYCDVTGSVEMFEQFRPGLQDLDGFSRIILIYVFHRSRGWDLLVTPFLDCVPHGVFATRAPRRPARIGISVVKLLEVTGSGVLFESPDMIEGTPLLDIKPYIPECDSFPDEKTGWFPEKSNVARVLSDGRFADKS